MFEQIQTLPCTERHPSVLNGDREAGLGKRGPQMRRHVVQPLVIVRVIGRAFRRDPPEKGLKVLLGRRSRILLNEKRGRAVFAEEGEQASRDARGLKPAFDFVRDLVKPLPRGTDGERVEVLPDHARLTQISPECCRQRKSRSITRAAFETLAGWKPKLVGSTASASVALTGAAQPIPETPAGLDLLLHRSNPS